MAVCHWAVALLFHILVIQLNLLVFFFSFVVSHRYWKHIVLSHRLVYAFLHLVCVEERENVFALINL